MKAKILLGFELKTAAPVYLGAEYFPETKQHWFPHTGIVAITRHGKTKTVKDLIRRGLEEGVFKRVLFIDSKDERDFKGMGIEVPPCFVDATEPLETKALLEAIVSSGMMYYLDKVIEEFGAEDSLEKVSKNINSKIDQADKGKLKIHGKELGKLRVIGHLLKKLLELVKVSGAIPELRLGESGAYVMNISLPNLRQLNLKKGFKQLMVKSAVQHLLAEYRDTVIVLDEFHIIAPQKYQSAAKEYVSDLIREGASKGISVIVIDQTLSGVDKESIKEVKNWLLGQQTQTHEIQHTLDALEDAIEGLRIRVGDVRQLRRGQFIVATDDFVKKVYAAPLGCDENLAKKCAQDKATPEEVMSSLKEKLAPPTAEKAHATSMIAEKPPLTAFANAVNRDLSSIERRLGEVEGNILWSGEAYKQLDNRITAVKLYSEDLHLRIVNLEKSPVSPGQHVSVELETPQTELTVTRRVVKLGLPDTDLRAQLCVLMLKWPDETWTIRKLADSLDQHGWRNAPPNIVKAMKELAGLGLVNPVQSGARVDYRLVKEKVKLQELAR